MMRRLAHASAVTHPRSMAAVGVRTVVTAGQYNPLHTFQVGTDVDAPATSRDQFLKLVSNPGPLRVVYAKDYLDWYYRAYNERVKYQEQQETLRSGASGKVVGDKLGVDAATGLPVALRAKSAPRTQHGDALAKKGLAMVDEATIQHGRFDLFERAPQFPAIHIDRCQPHHIRELLEEHLIDHEVCSDDVWRRALLYRGMMRAKRTSYPARFQYILDEIDRCTFSFADAKHVPAALGTVSESLIGNNGVGRFPTLAIAQYYEQLALRYHVDNTSDAHVVLRCHQRADADTVLMSNPPPRSLDEIKSSWKQPNASSFIPAAATAAAFPPLNMLFDDAGNLSLAKILLFAEFNCAVTTDPFTKYPTAASTLLRPTPSENRDLERARSMTEKVSAARTALLPNSRFVHQNVIDSRGRDILRLSDHNSRADAEWFGAGKGKGGRGGNASSDLAGEVSDDMSAPGAASFNPRTIRGELRDATSRRIVLGIKNYQDARKLTTNIADVGRFEDSLNYVRQSSASTRYRSTMHRPSPQHFLRLVTSDTHISLCTVLLGDRHQRIPTELQQQISTSARADANGVTVKPETPAEVAQRLREKCADLAANLYLAALDYHVEAQRRVHIQAIKVAASLVDRAVEDALRIVRHVDGGANPSLDSPLSALRDPYVPFASRMLDEYGFPTVARVEDYKRWTAAPAI